MSTGTTTVSIIIPTKNRTPDLEATIDSILRQTLLPLELIIIDQSKEKSFLKSLPFPLKYIHDPKLSGASTARNAGIERATGDIWLFLDDDVILEPTFIEELLAAYAPDVTGVSGIITNYGKSPKAMVIWETLFARGPFFDERYRAYWRAEQLMHGPPIRVRQFTGALMSFRADAIREMRFDDKLTGSSPGEDIDFCARLPEGSTLLIAPRARLVHNRSPKGRSSSHWLSLHSQVSSYMRERHWKAGLFNNLFYLWLSTGYVAAATISCLKRMSWEPLQAWREGARKGASIAAGDRL